MQGNGKIWFAVDVRLVPDAVGAIEFALLETGADGTEMDLLGTEKTDAETVCVTGYFSQEPDENELRRRITQALNIYDLPADLVKEVSSRTVENRDWLAEWKKHWRPTETERFIIAPPWEKVKDAGKIVIRIEPSMAFGTGTHETTRLCLRAIEQNYSPEMSFFDVGTGTGILAIAAAKLKSKVQSPKFKVQDSSLKTSDFGLWTLNSISACDTDADSVEIARENAGLNGASGIKFYVGSIEEDTPPFDFVCANLTADSIVPLLPLLVEKTEKLLLLSGILREQEDWVTGKLRELQISDYKIQTDGEWISLLAASGKYKTEN